MLLVTQKPGLNRNFLIYLPRRTIGYAPCHGCQTAAATVSQKFPAINHLSHEWRVECRIVAGNINISRLFSDHPEYNLYHKLKPEYIINLDPTRNGFPK